MFQAVARFLCCERLLLARHHDPVGMWVMRTAESVVFTCCRRPRRAEGVDAAVDSFTSMLMRSSTTG
jgi:hypothetical protein